MMFIVPEETCESTKYMVQQGYQEGHEKYHLKQEKDGSAIWVKTHLQFKQIIIIIIIIMILEDIKNRGKELVRN
jgi:hypothetical protein